MPTQPPRVAVIGGGPAGLIAAEVLAAGGAAVTLYDRMPSVGRKFLLAGRGGLNLTHSEPLERLLTRYAESAECLRGAIETFPPAALRAWAETLGEPTFVGSSGRVFPRSFKASPLLRAWLVRLRGQGVTFALRHRWIGWDEHGRLVFRAPAGEMFGVHADAVVLALGGASWPRLGSDGAWVDAVSKAGTGISPLVPANSGFIAAWSEQFRTRFEGQPLKRTALSFGDRVVRGEAIITRDGLEGGGIYALSARLRNATTAAGEAILMIDLKPETDVGALAQRLAAPRGKQSLANFLRKAANLSPAAIGILREAAANSGALLAAMPTTTLAGLIKNVPVRLIGPAPIERAISTAGGIKFVGLDAHFMLRRRPGVFIAGEMLDWEAPTGGYLLQACFATGAAAGRGALRWLAREERNKEAAIRF